MKKESVNKLFDEWVEATVLFEAGPDEFGAVAWHHASGEVMAFSRVFCELAGDQVTYQKTYFADCKAQAAARADEILEAHRERHAAALAITGRYATQA